MKRWSPRLIAAVLGVAVAGWASSAFGQASAQASAQQAATRPAIPPKSTWYGWEILVPAGLTAATSTALWRLSGRDVGLAAVGGELAAGATSGVFVHWAHGYPERGLLGVGLRVSATFGCTLLAANAVCSDGCRRAESTATFFAGMGVGSLLGAIADAAILAYDEPLEWMRSSKPKGRHSRRVGPPVSIGIGPSGIGIGGFF